jgi:hypothetical protein
MIPTIPAPDPVGAPAPIGLLTALLVALLPLHLIPMNVALGGGFLAAWAARCARRGAELERHRCRALLASFTPALLVATAAMITFGIAPLLFLQVVYGPLFYTSSVLMAWLWLAVIALLLAGYYSYYAFAFRHRRGAQHASLALLGAVLLATVGFLFVNNMTLMLHPERWAQMYAASAHGLHLNALEPVLGPRFLHFLTASLAVTGLFVALLARGREDDAGQWMRRLGARLFAGATHAQILVGLAFLLSLDRSVRRLFLGDSLRDTALLWSAVALALLATLLVRRRPALAAGLTLVTVFGMSFVRHRVREAMVAPVFSVEGLRVVPQYGPMAIFAAVLIAGIATLVWMSVRFVRARPSKA